MKCLNMKIRDILIFILNFMAIYSVKPPQDKTLQRTALVPEEQLYNNFEKYCPQLYKTIRDNNITDYTLNCKQLNSKHLKLNEENVLGFACLIVKHILVYMCSNKINMTSDRLIQHNYSTLCPFNFSHLELLGFNLKNNDFINELKNPDHCKEVCRDLDSTKLQCIVLGNFNNYLNPIGQPSIQMDSTTPALGEPLQKSEHPEVINQNTENGVVREVVKSNTENVAVNTAQDKMQHSKKNDTKEVSKTSKIEANIEISKTKSIGSKNNPDKLLNEEKKTEKTVSSTPMEGQKTVKKIEIPESERKISLDENPISENNEPKLKNEEINEEEDLINEDDSSSMAEPVPVKTDFDEPPKLQKVETPEVGIDSTLKGKEIYSGEGFFQAEDSHFFFYFIMVSSIIVVGYLAFHNKNKILAYALEGTNSRRSRRRPNPARYRKLETNLEEVISSNTTNAASSSVVY